MNDRHICRVADLEKFSSCSVQGKTAAATSVAFLYIFEQFGTTISQLNHVLGVCTQKEGSSGPCMWACKAGQPAPSLWPVTELLLELADTTDMG